jgi:Short C-terminal domain
MDLFEALMGRKKGERVGLFGYVSQSERIARATEATARAEQERLAQTSPPLLADELAKLASLRDQGVLTEQEFAAQKQRLLAGQGKPTGGFMAALREASAKSATKTDRKRGGRR